MKRLLICIPLALGGCSALGSTNIAPDAAMCAAALLAGGIVNPSGIPQLALNTPACTALAQDALAAAIKAAQTNVAAAQHNARMIR